MWVGSVDERVQGVGDWDEGSMGVLDMVDGGWRWDRGSFRLRDKSLGARALEGYHVVGCAEEIYRARDEWYRLNSLGESS